MTYLFRSAVLASMLSLLSAGFFGVAANAAMISTDDAMRQHTVSTITTAMQEDAVAERLAAYGVDQAMVEARIAALSDAELAELAANFDDIEDGAGVIEVLGVVFLVLLVLELVGVTNVFSSF